LSSWPIWCQVYCWSRASWTVSWSRFSVWAMRLTRGVESDAGVAEPVGGAQRGEGVDCVVEDVEAVIVDAWCGQVVGWDKVEYAAGHDAFWSMLVSRLANRFSRPVCCLAAASSCWACRVGRNWMLVWKNVQFSQTDSKLQSSSGGRAQLAVAEHPEVVAA
jgi:hypothetical protein